MNNVQRFLHRHSTDILAIFASAGVGVTVYTAINATPKALKLVEEAEELKGDKLTFTEKVKVAWVPYVPTMVSGAITIGCIFGINHLSHKAQTSLASAYAVLSNSYSEYRKKMEELHGDSEKDARAEIISAKYDPNVEIQNGTELFFDSMSYRYFKSSMDNVLRAESVFLEAVRERGYGCINEFYEVLGVPPVQWGWALGWFDYESNDPYNCKELQFEYEEIYVGEGPDKTKCWILSPNRPASTDYII